MRTFAPFSIARLPRIIFGAGAIASLPEEAAVYGEKALLVTGARSFQTGQAWQPLADGLRAAGIKFNILEIAGEPSPELVDEAVAAWRGKNIDIVIGIGGGSCLDAAKAIAGLLPHGNSVLDHLEGVGAEKPFTGPSLPFIAAPTTAGTGSEATKNAVLSRRGPGGFKKSFRDEALVARVAVVDPDLIATCPRALMAADGMDAFTQLLESYVSLRANPFTEALALSGLEAFGGGFFAALEGRGEGRSRLAYAALLSGICLAQTGLGAVHGLASPLGAFFPIPHGVVCGTLVAPATEANISALSARETDNSALAKYARVGELLTGTRDPAALINLLSQWTDKFEIPRLGVYGVGEKDLARIVTASRGSSMKTNPIVLTDAEIAKIVESRL